jgi:hypothetical protein
MLNHVQHHCQSNADQHRLLQRHQQAGNEVISMMSCWVKPVFQTLVIWLEQRR